MNRLWRALKAAWAAFVVAWKAEPAVTPRIASPAQPSRIRYQVVRKEDGHGVLVYNEFNGGEAGRLMCAERDAGNVAEFWMCGSDGNWILRDWSPR
jgi:hypothetical protein